MSGRPRSDIVNLGSIWKHLIIYIEFAQGWKSSRKIIFLSTIDLSFSRQSHYCQVNTSYIGLKQKLRISFDLKILVHQHLLAHTMPPVNGKEVGPIGFGLMGLTWRAKPCSQEQAFEAMHTALQNGCMYCDPELTV